MKIEEKIDNYLDEHEEINDYLFLSNLNEDDNKKVKELVGKRKELATKINAILGTGKTEEVIKMRKERAALLKQIKKIKGTAKGYRPADVKRKETQKKDKREEKSWDRLYKDGFDT